MMFNGAVGGNFRSDVLNFDSIRIKIASPESVRGWSYGEVKRPETYNYRTLKPEKDGLLCPVIFGPIKNYECLCGKYKKYKYKGIVCEKCGVEVTESSVRRERMGHIDLVMPVVHTWFLYSSPSCISLLLDLPLKSLEKVAYFDSYIVTNAGTTKLARGQLLSEDELGEAIGEYGIDAFKADTGAKAIRDMLAAVDLVREKEYLISKLSEGKSNVKIVKRLEVIDGFITSGNKPGWMVFNVLPVLPPDLRPCVILEADKFVSSDLNDLYRRVINRNNRLKNLISLGAPEIILKNECRMLQEAVDSLFYNEKRGNAVHSNGRPHKSLSEILSGKQGRFRQNLLGKRVDYSGRSVIVVGPKLKLYQCGLPKRMALELFKPFIYSRLLMYGKAASIKSAKHIVDQKGPEVYEILEDVVSYMPILLNRAPTLHRLGIQAFEPLLVDHNAIELHPLVCTAFNADFDGDQMAVHLPLSIEAQMESRVLMLASNNLLSPSSGNSIIVPNQDIILGIYYITNAASDRVMKDIVYYNMSEVMYDLQVTKKLYPGSIIQYHDMIRNADGTTVGSDLYTTTPGRVMIYSLLPKNQTKIPFTYFNKVFTKKDVVALFDLVYASFTKDVLVGFADGIKELGFKYSTLGGISIGKDDIVIPSTKQERVDAALESVKEYEKQFADGYITEREKYNKVVDAWHECTNKVANDMIAGFKIGADTSYMNAIYMMAHSGARGSLAQIKQLAGMRGLIAKASGEIIETPIISNFKEGLTASEYFNSAHGARKGLADTALKTADAGYLTRRLVDVAQNCVINEVDCGSIEGILYTSRFDGTVLIKHVARIVHGRFLTKDVIFNGKVIAKNGTLVTDEISDLIEKCNLHEIEARSAVKCKTRIGLCQKCYGADLVTKNIAELGQAVGIVAAQSIGEPGTQLTMRTFHVGGVATKNLDKPFISTEVSGTVSLDGIRLVTNKGGEVLVVVNNASVVVTDESQKTFKYVVPYGSRLYVADGQKVKVGDKIADLDIYNTPIISEYSGSIAYTDLINSSSFKEVENEETGHIEKTVIPSKLHPGIKIMGHDGNLIKNLAGSSVVYYLTVGSSILVSDNQKIEVGDVIARMPKNSQKTRDITGGLPRVVSLFEARRPKITEVISSCDGIVCDIKSYKTKKKIIIAAAETGELVEFSVPSDSHIAVHNGTKVLKGDVIVLGERNPYDILAVHGVDAFVDHMLSEIQGVYELQGVKINDKHIEVILRYMLRKVRVTDSGDSLFFLDQKLDINEFNDAVRDLKKAKKKQPHCELILEGITRAALQNESFISSASFQETVKVLTAAAIRGKQDDLVGIKENVVVGRVIPAGTGYSQAHYRKKMLDAASNGE